MNTMTELYQYIKKLEDENARLLAASRGMVETIARQELEIVQHKREIENYRRLSDEKADALLNMSDVLNK